MKILLISILFFTTSCQPKEDDPSPAQLAIESGFILPIEKTTTNVTFFSYDNITNNFKARVSIGNFGTYLVDPSFVKEFGEPTRYNLEWINSQFLIVQNSFETGDYLCNVNSKITVTLSEYTQLSVPAQYLSCEDAD